MKFFQINLVVVVYLPNTREQAAKQEGAVSLDKRGEESKDAVDGERDEQSLSTANPISQTTPHKSTHHHAQVDNES